MKKVYKYGTGMEIPKGAIYLTTLVEEVTTWKHDVKSKLSIADKKERLVWHYFLVEEK
jgi:hypothetical protein